MSKFKLSDGGLSVLLLIILGRILIIATSDLIFANPITYSQVIALSILICIISPILWYLSIKPLLYERLCYKYNSWYEGLFFASGLFSLSGVWTLVTGRPFSRYNHIEVAKSCGYPLLILAGVLLITGMIIYLVSRR